MSDVPPAGEVNGRELPPPMNAWPAGSDVPGVSMSPFWSRATTMPLTPAWPMAFSSSPAFSKHSPCRKRTSVRGALPVSAARSRTSPDE